MLPPSCLSYVRSPGYFNGTPAATAVFGIDLIAPQHFNNKSIDLVVSGPNEGQNNGPFLFTLSGTIGAAYASVGRGIPAVALSAGNNTHRSFTTNTGAPTDPANLAAKVTANFVKGLAKGVNLKHERLLPLGVGIKYILSSLNYIITYFFGTALISQRSALVTPASM